MQELREISNYFYKTSGIYKRLIADKPSVVISNYRKNMLIHPFQDRGLSVREAARLQSFPDKFVFKGSLMHIQQQIGNAVPPLLAKAVFEKIVEYKFIKDDFGITGLELNVYGYYTGHTFLNILGISQQVPATLEVATNNTSCKRRFKIKNRETILYKGKIIINRFNYRILQFLDCFYLLTEDDVQEHKQLLKNYIKNNLSKGDFEQYIGLYPSKIFKAIVEGGLLDAFR